MLYSVFFKKTKYIFWISFIILTIFWLVCYITFFPGAGNYDTYYQLQSPIFASSQHPIGYSFLLNFFIVQIGYKLLGSSIIGWAIFSLLQMLIMAFAISFAVAFLAKRGLHKFLIALLVLFYGLLPIYSYYAIFAIKDVAFAIEVLFLYLLLIKLVESNGNLLKNKIFIIFYLLIGIAMYLTRSNAVVVYVLTTLTILFVYRKQYANILILIFCLPLLINSLVNYAISSKYDIKHYFQESIAIPIQQLFAVVYQDGNIEKSDLEYIDSLLEIELIKENYSVGNVDAIKWHSEFKRDYLDETKIEFIKVWFKNLLKNPDIYIESYLLQTYYLWSFNFSSLITNVANDTQSDFQGSYIEKIKDMYNIRCDDLLDDSIQTKLENYYYKNVNFLSEGTCFWLLIYFILIYIFKNRSNYLITIAPVVSVWLSFMLASPLLSSLRYIFPIILILPLIISHSLLLKNHN